MNRFTPIVLMSALLMSGCISHYVNPSDRETATLTLSVDLTRKSGYAIAQAFGDDKCTAHPNGTRLAFFGTMVDADPHHGKTVKIDANKEFVLTYSYGDGVPGMTRWSRCQVTLAFKPVPGGVYKSHFVADAVECRSRLSEVRGGGALMTPVSEEPVNTRQLKPACTNRYNG